MDCAGGGWGRWSVGAYHGSVNRDGIGEGPCVNLDYDNGFAYGAGSGSGIVCMLDVLNNEAGCDVYWEMEWNGVEGWVLFTQ
jgi:hypothetical protein